MAAKPPFFASLFEKQRVHMYSIAIREDYLTDVEVYNYSPFKIEMKLVCGIVIEQEVRNI